MVRAIVLICSCFCLALSAFGEARITTSVSPESGTVSDSFNFTVTIEGTQRVSPPLLTGGDDFKLRLIGPQNFVSIVNGNITQRISYIYQLTPKKEGELLTPSVEIELDGSKQSIPPKKVIVGQDKADTTPSDHDEGKEVFLKQSISDNSVYEGQQIVNSLTLYTRVELRDLQLQDSSFDGFWQESLGQEQRSSKNINGIDYMAVQLRKALFPLSSGNFTIPRRIINTKIAVRQKASQTFDPFSDDLFDNFFGGSSFKDVTIHSEPIDITVKPLPAKPTDLPVASSDYIPVGSTSMNVTYSPDVLKVGESKTVVIDVSSEGNLNPLKGLKIDGGEWVKVYEETPEMKVDPSGAKLVTDKKFHFSLVPLKGGLLRVPGAQLNYFDPKDGAYKVAKSSDIAFVVEGDPQVGVVPAHNTANAVPTNESVVKNEGLDERSQNNEYIEPSALERFTEHLSLSFALLVIACAIIILAVVILFKRSAALSRNMRKTMRAVDSASDFNELNVAVRVALSSYVKTDLSTASVDEITSLLSARVGDPSLIFELRGILDELQVNLYGDSSLKPGLRTFSERVRALLVRLT